jgi:hypothetical protein
MTKLKEVYNIKKELIINDITTLGSILKEYTDIDAINVNSDNTIYLESNCGIDSIKGSLDSGVIRWIDRTIEAPIGMLYSTLPISNNACIIRI